MTEERSAQTLAGWHGEGGDDEDDGGGKGGRRALRMKRLSVDPEKTMRTGIYSRDI